MLAVAGAVLACFGEATCVTRQVLFNGFASGLVYGLLALGIILIFRSTRVLNFAVADMGLPATVLFGLLVLNWNVPFWPALVLALAVGALTGMIVELTVVRRLFNAPRVILFVATVGVTQLMRGVVQALPRLEGGNSSFPTPIGQTFLPLDRLRISGPQLVIVLMVPILAVCLTWWLNRSVFGRAVAASADNPELSRLSQINPKTISTFVWVVGGALSTGSMLLLSFGGNATNIDDLGPVVLSKALVVAVLAGLRSFPRAIVAGIAVGELEAILRFNFLTESGLTDFVLLLAVLAAVYLEGRRTSVEASMRVTAREAMAVARRGQGWMVRNCGQIVLAALLALAVVLPVLVEIRPSRLVLYATIAGFGVCAASVTVITGWSGQLSLAQMTFAGIGALTAAALKRGAELDVSIGGWQLVQGQLVPMPYVVALAGGTAAAALAAVIVGVGALRVRGLLLAVSTFVFAITAQQYIFHRPFFSDGQQSVRFRREVILGVDFSDQRNYFFLSVVALVLVISTLARLRRSGVGRSMIAVRENPTAAAAYGVAPDRTKILAFALAGAIAGFGGVLLGGLVRNIQFNEALFLVEDSLAIVSIVVVGGLGSVLGPVLGALWVKGLPAFWPDSDVVPFLTSGIGLLFVLMYFPGGLAELVHRLRAAAGSWLSARFPARDDGSTAAARDPAPVRVRSHLRPPLTPDHDIALCVDAATVRFGGLTAVSGVSLEVGTEEIVGLIGTNGAGKTTLMNAIGGYVPSKGKFELMGADVSKRPPHVRARLGLGRTFQASDLFSDLTVRETIQVALEARKRSSFIRTSLNLHRPHERRQAAEANELIDLLGLGEYADSFIADLSTGTRRVVALGGVVALGATVLCLDEPTSGLAQRETEAFAPVILRIRSELQASLLIVEHDMPLIMSISDRVYCLEMGQVIAEGRPEVVRRDPSVIASYLGTDERAIARSGAFHAENPGSC